MTQSGNEAAGDLGAARTAESAPWAPFRNRAFRWLWIGVLISWTGTWMQTLGAQWLVVDQPNAAALVSLVQAAITLPVMMLALPGGVLADSFDRRWLLFVIQVYFFVVGILLAVLTAAGQMPPALLIAFTFLLGRWRGGAAAHLGGHRPRTRPENTAAGGVAA
jgi:MFS family permease